MADYDAPAAVQAVAEMGKEAIAATRDAGGFIRAVSGTMPENAFGLVNDWLKYKRASNVIAYSKRLADNCRNAGIDPSTLGSPTPSIMLPLLEAASMEEREELIELWDKLLLAAIDPATRSRVRAQHIEIIKRLEPMDAVILQHYGNLSTDAKVYAVNKHIQMYIESDFVAAVRRMLPQSGDDDVSVSLSNLNDLKLIAMGNYGFPNVTALARNLMSVVSRS